MWWAKLLMDTPSGTVGMTIDQSDNALSNWVPTISIDATTQQKVRRMGHFRSRVLRGSCATTERLRLFGLQANIDAGRLLG